ncbi:hypothetical protein GIB67_017588 [Kingdonia uniflora]|uniref:Subtilisin-like protease n=1 Tax=Kingdonia uniflora TaxID=39325 RepID=A0A7J7LN75_9MAGN|nr:hypothetical protein GIB67_017588 [Kingdonia uniflora]
MPKAFSDHHSWFEASLSSLSSRPSIVYTYSNVLHGFSATLSPSELRELENTPGFIYSIRDYPVKVDTTHTSDFLNLNPVTGAWPESNYSEDVIIGLVDTGVWPESDSFKDDGMPKVPSRWKGECVAGTQFNSSMCNNKLIGARYYNNGLAASIPNITFPMNSTRDTDGHGTHTSSTAGGNYVKDVSYFGYARGTAKGMAPRSHVAMYKALWDVGAVSSDILAAVDQALKDGVDALSMSLGTDGVALYEDPVAIASFAAMEKGIFVATSAGNQGPWYGSLHNGIPWVLTVGAGSIDREFNGVVTLSGGVSILGQALYPGNSSVNQVPLVFMNACNDSNTLLKKGATSKIIVCVDTDDSVSQQVIHVGNAQAAGGIFITNSSYLEFYLQSEFPAVFLSPQDGQSVLSYIQTSPNPKASMEFRKERIGTKPAPTVTIYSSRGPSSSYPGILKPDLIAPGNLVLAAWPQISPVTEVRTGELFNNFNLISGTSMSTPHAAGLAALLKGAHPEWSPAAIRSAMMTTADAVDNTLAPIKDAGYSYQVASPLGMGSGNVNPNKALAPGLIYDAGVNDYVNLLCSLNYTLKQIQIITKSFTNNCSNPSSDLNYPSFIAFFNVNSSSSANARVVREFRRTVTNVGDGTSSYKAALTQIEGFQLTVVPDTLVFKEKNEKLSYTLSLEGPSLMKEIVVHGAITWVDIGGKHMVRSPIVATSLSSH